MVSLAGRRRRPKKTGPAAGENSTQKEVTPRHN
jgi:hypothetical protein